MTQKPKLGQWEAIAKGEAYHADGSDPGVELNGAVNVPLGESAALRAVGSGADIGGYIDEVELGQPNYNRNQKRNGRVRVQWQPLSNLTLGGMALLQVIHAGSANAANDSYQRFDSNAVGINDHGKMFSGDVDWTPDWFNVFWTASLFDRTNSVVFDARDAVTSQIDSNRLPAGLGPGLDFLNPILQGIVANQIKGSPGAYYVSTNSQMSELRLSSNGGGPLVWTGGIYARKYHELLHLLASVNLSTPPVPPAVPTPSVVLIDVDTDSHSLATSLFGQVEYQWTSWLNTALGARYYREKLDVFGSGQVAAQDASSEDHLKFHAFTPRAVASIRVPDGFFSFADPALFYVSYAEGFRSGGANIQVAPEIPPTYRPDRLKAFELGTKLEMWGGRLITELALYHNQWLDVQVLTVPPGGSGSFTAVENQGNAAGNGVDWNFVLHPFKGLELYHSGGWIDTKFTTDSGAKFKGDPIDFVSPLTLAAGGSYGFTWPGGSRGAVRLDYSYAAVSRYQRQGNYDYRSDPVHMLNARLEINPQKVQFAIFGRNLLDNEGALDANQPERQARARPPTYGIDVKVTF
jgi:outer membrane receptor protein involved in Fe transport